MSQHVDGARDHRELHPDGPPRWAIHRDWRVWVMIGLMVLGMVVYILTLDERLGP